MDGRVMLWVKGTDYGFWLILGFKLGSWLVKLALVIAAKEFPRRVGTMKNVRDFYVNRITNRAELFTNNPLLNYKKIDGLNTYSYIA